MMTGNAKRVYLAVALLLVLAASIGIALLAIRVDGAPSAKSHFPWVVFLPIYTSLIPIYIGVARRRREKNKNG